MCQGGLVWIAKCWLVQTLGGVPPQCWFMCLPDSLVGGVLPSSRVDLTNPWLQCDSVILPTCHMKELDLDGPACLGLELQHGMFLLNWNHRQLDSLFLAGSLGRGCGRGLCGAAEVHVQLCSDVAETLASRLTPWTAASWFAKWRR